MTIATISSKGQITLPSEIRKAIKAGPGDKLLMWVDPTDNKLHIEVLPSPSLLELAGSLAPPQGVEISGPINTRGAMRRRTVAKFQQIAAQAEHEAKQTEPTGE